MERDIGTAARALSSDELAFLRDEIARSVGRVRSELARLENALRSSRGGHDEPLLRERRAAADSCSFSNLHPAHPRAGAA